MNCGLIAPEESEGRADRTALTAGEGDEQGTRAADPATAGRLPDGHAAYGLGFMCACREGSSGHSEECWRQRRGEAKEEGG